jgi:hypothetical protein
MATARLLLALLGALTLVSAAPAAPAAPSGLHGFLFRADEPSKHEFARTPSFAWAPVPGATRYEFELATTNTFRENGLIFADRQLKTPVAAVQLTLPWITGSPYSLYARVRAVVGGNASGWSEPFGFNMRQPTVPKPLPSYPGLLRWTPVEGANAYEVWLVDIDKKLTVFTNVLDEREFYTLHQSPAWTSKVRWRLRTRRADVQPQSSGPGRQNGMPATSYGPWSPVYESKNPAFDTGTLRLVGTISDVVATGRNGDPAHRLMPAFAFAGNKALDGTAAEFFRVYVFTDADCLNRVFTGSVTGSPAFSGRPRGPLSLPRDTATLAAGRSKYLSDGDSGVTYASDGEALTPNEVQSPATPTTGLPGVGQSTPTAPSDPSKPDQPSAPATGAGVTFLSVAGDWGAPIDLWDTNWPEGGYYWTVIPVAAHVPGAVSTSVAEGAAIGATQLTIGANGVFAVGDVITIGNPSNQETATITAANANVLTLSTALKQGHGIGEPVQRTSGNLVYRDLELPQEVCASGRVMRFGKSSEPALVASGTPFASGLSPAGRLTSAVSAGSRFYGSPLVAWAPALGADAYHIQWSQTGSPFKPMATSWQGKGSTAGVLTFATSAVLPLQPGTWWYRVRGISFSLPTNAQYMGWSEPTRLVVTKPTFRVATKKKR